MWWKWILQAAIAIGADKWARRKALELAAKIRKRAADRADAALVAAGHALDEKVAAASQTIVIRHGQDTLQPGSIVSREGRPYRITKLLMFNALGAFYEAERVEP